MLYFYVRIVNQNAEFSLCILVFPVESLVRYGEQYQKACMSFTSLCARFSALLNFLSLHFSRFYQLMQDRKFAKLFGGENERQMGEQGGKST